MIIADEKQDEIIALKRVSWPSVEEIMQGKDAKKNNTSSTSGQSRGKSRVNSSKPVVRSVVKLPDTGGIRERRMVDVLIVSDAYVGMVWRVDEVEIPPAPTVDDGGDDKGGKGSKQGGGR